MIAPRVKVTIQSTEEEDQVVQSTKKIKPNTGTIEQHECNEEVDTNKYNLMETNDVTNYGDWMIAQRPRRRNLAKNRKQTINQNNSAAKVQETNKENINQGNNDNGSQFHVI